MMNTSRVAVRLFRTAGMSNGSAIATAVSTSETVRYATGVRAPSRPLSSEVVMFDSRLRSPSMMSGDSVTDGQWAAASCSRCHSGCSPMPALMTATVTASAARAMEVRQPADEVEVGVEVPRDLVADDVVSISRCWCFAAPRRRIRSRGGQ